MGIYVFSVNNHCSKYCYVHRSPGARLFQQSTLGSSSLAEPQAAQVGTMKQFILGRFLWQVSRTGAVRHSHLPPTGPPRPRPLTCGVSSECLGTRSYETTSRDQRGKIQMLFSSTGACTTAKFPIANHHSQINTQLYSASLICLIWQQRHSDSEFDVLSLTVYCKFRDSKRCWQRYSASSDLCLFDWLGV